MSTIIGTDEFTNVPLIEVGDKVEGGLNGAANKQALALVNRTEFLNNKQKQVDQKVNNLGPNDVGADPQGTASGLLASHTDDVDAHQQYLKIVDADSKFVTLTGANLPNGYLQLDPTGKIPAELLSLISTKYEVVANEAGRLALPSNPNLLIVVQTDVDQLFYLNGGLDPSVSSNWFPGQSATVSGVASVFGRTNHVVAEAGDYNADQINETANRVFVTPAQKQTWDQKQDKLVSGTTIKTFKGVSLLGSGDFNPTPAQLGCAAATHTHPTTDIVDFSKDVRTVIGGSIVPGTGISVGVDSTTGKTVVSTNLNADGSTGYITVERLGSLAGQMHGFNFSPISSFGYDAFALINEKGAANQTYLYETFDSANIANYNVSPGCLFTGYMEGYRGETLTLLQDGTLFKANIRNDIASQTFTEQFVTVVPKMSSNTTPSPYKASASSEYAATYAAFKAFDQTSAGGVGDGWATGNGQVPTDAAPQWLRIDLASPVKITGYGIQNRLAGENAYIKKWQLQGSNDNGTTWENLGGVITDNDSAFGKVRNFQVSLSKAYSSYRLLITDSVSTYTFAFIQEWTLYTANNVMFLADDGTTGYGLSADGLSLVSYPNVTAANIDANGFVSAANITANMLSAANVKKLVASKAVTMIIDALPGPQIALPKTIRPCNDWAAINYVRGVFTLTGSGTIRYAVTRDNSEWFVWNGSAWVSIGALTPNASGANKLLSQGMDPSLFGAINTTQWKLLFGGNNPDFIAIAHAISGPTAASGAKVDSFSFNVDNAASWRKASPSEVEIRWRSDSITFKTVNAGDYVLAYQIP